MTNESVVVTDRMVDAFINQLNKNNRYDLLQEMTDRDAVKNGLTAALQAKKKDCKNG